MNGVIIAGHLGVDAEVRYTPDGQKIVSFRMATNIRKKGQDKTIWWNVTIWGDRFDRIVPYLKKGSGVIVWGDMGEPRMYTDKSGNTQVALDVTAEMIRLNPFGRSDRQEGAASAGQAAPGHAYPQSNQPNYSNHGFPEGDFSYNPQAQTPAYDGYAPAYGKGNNQGVDNDIPF